MTGALPRFDTLLRPPIAISRTDHVRLQRLAETLSRTNADLADLLFAELVRAEVLPDEDTTREVVRMGSTLEYETTGGDKRIVTLVFPGEEDIAAGKVSILTPIGIALIGLSTGDAISWSSLGGRTHQLTVTRIEDGSARPVRPQAATRKAS